MKNIIIFITSLSSGGAEHQVIELSKLLVEKKYDVTIATFADVKDHYQIPTSVKRKRIGEGMNNILKLIYIFIYFFNIKTDCVISFGQRESFLCIIPLLFRKNIKVISSERNLTINKPSFYEKSLTGFLYRRAYRIVPNSYSQSEYLCSVNNKLRKKIKVITNYTDISEFKYSGYKSNGSLRIGVFARYNKQKNYERFVEAIRILKSRTNKPFIIEWYGNKYFKDKTLNKDYLIMQQLVNESNLQSVILLNNHVDNVCDLLPSFDVVCLPSLHEGFSNSISEAISCGRPMIVSDVSDNKLMVHEGENGFLFNPYDINDMVCAFEKFFSTSENERKLMSAKSREIAEKLFDIEVFINNYISIITGA